MDYIEEHKKSGLKVGDKVKVIAKSFYGDRGWRSIWNGKMDAFIGHEYFIVSDENEAGFILYDSAIDECFVFPYFVLEKVEKQQPISGFTPGDVVRVLVVAPDFNDVDCIYIGEEYDHAYVWNPKIEKAACFNLGIILSQTNREGKNEQKAVLTEPDEPVYGLTIKTKFSPGEKVYIMYCGKITIVTVSFLTIKVYSAAEISIEYITESLKSTNGSLSLSEDLLFRTAEELARHLVENIVVSED